MTILSCLCEVVVVAGRVGEGCGSLVVVAERFGNVFGTFDVPSKKGGSEMSLERFGNARNWCRIFGDARSRSFARVGGVRSILDRAGENLW